MKDKALIIANGKIEDIGILKDIKEEYNFILAADGGTNHCLQANILPDLVIGDLDSISHEALQMIRDNNILVEKFPIKKDAADTELAIDFLIDKGFKDISLMGVTGSRMDHTLSNILLLDRLKAKGVHGKIIDENNTVYLVDGQLILPKQANYYISIIPITDMGMVISLKGFEYELTNRQVEFASTFCISNRIVEEKGIITIHKGKGLVLISKD